MELGKKRDLPSNTSMVACTVEDALNSDFINLEPNKILNPGKWYAAVFVCSTDYVTLGNICELWQTPQTWLVFCCSHCIVLLHDAACCAILQPKLPSSLSNILATKNSSNEDIFCSR
jgi:hypothetical protein